MPTFLQLVEELHTEAGASGVAPTAVTNQRGEAKRLVGWVKRADSVIQCRWLNWKFLRSSAQFDQDTVVDMDTLTVPVGWGFWDEATFHVLYPGETLPQYVQVVEYEDVKSEIIDTSRSGPPERIVLMPNGDLRIDPKPDAIYTITADYFIKPVLLAANADVSAIPEQYHSAIIGRALMLYGNFENAAEQKSQGAELYADFLQQLETHELPNKFGSRSRTGGNFTVQTDADLY